MNKKPHPQVQIKVNILVDEKVAPLVELLLQIENVVTISSCQCDHKDCATVQFSYANDVIEKEEFFYSFIKSFIKRTKGKDIFGELKISYDCYFGGLFAEICVSYNQLNTMITVITNVVEDLKK